MFSHEIPSNRITDWYMQSFLVAIGALPPAFLADNVAVSGLSPDCPRLSLAALTPPPVPPHENAREVNSKPRYFYRRVFVL